MEEKVEEKSGDEAGENIAPPPKPLPELEFKGWCAYCPGRLIGGISAGWGACEWCGAI